MRFTAAVALLSASVVPVASTTAPSLPLEVQLRPAGAAAFAPRHRKRSYTNAGPQMLWQPSTPYVRISNIFWPHIPKTSTTFARTVFSYACGERSDHFELYATNRPPNLKRGACSGTLAEAQDALLNRTSESRVTWFHMPVPWSRGHNPIPTVHAITLLREPAARLHSEFMHMSSNWVCCGAKEEETLPGQSWGWDFETRLAAVTAAHGQVAEKDPLIHLRRTGEMTLDPELKTGAARLRKYRDALVTSNSLYGCMTKMLIGRGCHESHSLTRKEVERAMQLWNIPMEMKHIEELFAACDGDGDGQIDYNEFVDHLARDTVNPAAMGKRGMQSKEAMGVDAQEHLAHQLGHRPKAAHASQDHLGK